MSNYREYFVLEKQLINQGHDVERSEIIEQFTDEKKNSLRDLTPMEYKSLLKWIRTAFKMSSNNSDWQQSPENRMRRKVIALLRKNGFKDKNGLADLSAINKWCISHGHAHKDLNKYNYKELVKLVTQAENMAFKNINR